MPFSERVHQDKQWIDNPGSLEAALLFRNLIPNDDLADWKIE